MSYDFPSHFIRKNLIPSTCFQGTKHSLSPLLAHGEIRPRRRRPSANGASYLLSSLRAGRLDRLYSHGRLLCRYPLFSNPGPPSPSSSLPAELPHPTVPMRHRLLHPLRLSLRPPTSSNFLSFSLPLHPLICTV